MDKFVDKSKMELKMENGTLLSVLCQSEETKLFLSKPETTTYLSQVSKFSLPPWRVVPWAATSPRTSAMIDTRTSVSLLQERTFLKPRSQATITWINASELVLETQNAVVLSTTLRAGMVQNATISWPGSEKTEQRRVQTGHGETLNASQEAKREYFKIRN